MAASDDSLLVRLQADEMSSAGSSMGGSTNPHHRRLHGKRRSRRRDSSSDSEENHGHGRSPASAVNHRRSLAVGAVLALCLFNVFDVDIRISRSTSGSGRRSLLSTLYLSGPSTLLPWAEHHLVDVTDRPDFEAETALFWRELPFFAIISDLREVVPLISCSLLIQLSTPTQ